MLITASAARSLIVCMCAATATTPLAQVKAAGQQRPPPPAQPPKSVLVARSLRAGPQLWTIPRTAPQPGPLPAPLLKLLPRLLATRHCRLLALRELLAVAPHLAAAHPSHQSLPLAGGARRQHPSPLLALRQPSLLALSWGREWWVLALLCTCPARFIVSRLVTCQVLGCLSRRPSPASMPLMRRQLQDMLPASSTTSST